ncbi:MAG TPA: phage tail protein [Tepidiformaceae bacterium]|nr:phage tail protein [Tepidiformaceae bacterium]
MASGSFGFSVQASVGSGNSSPPLVRSEDPWNSYRFAIEIQGIQEAEFQECTGMSVEVKVEPYEEGGLNGFTHKLPGRRSYSNITLKRGFTSSTLLIDWLDRVATKSAKASEMRNVSILFLDNTGATLRRWNLSGAFPTKWTGPSLNSTSSTALIETLEIAFQELEIA